MWFHLRYVDCYLRCKGLPILIVFLSFRCVGLQARDVKANEDYICRRCAVKNPASGEADNDKDEFN